MKKLSSRWIGFGLALTLFGAIGAETKLASAKSNSTHIVRAVARPSQSDVMYSVGTTNSFEFHVYGGTLSQLTLEIPKGIRLNGDVRVSDDKNKPIDANISIEGDTLKINFLQPINPEQTVNISLTKVKSRNKESSVWLYPITARYLEMDAEIPLGTARIQTYD